jgi:hypothetical protein
VASIAEQRSVGARGVHPELVQAAREGLELQQASTAVER